MRRRLRKMSRRSYRKTAKAAIDRARALSQKDSDTIVAWVTAGAPKGDPKDMPAPVNFVEGWGIPKPDMIFQLPKEFSVPESGMVEYQYAIVPTGFTEDKWVQAVEVRPTERSVVHHIIGYIREPGSNYFKDQKPEVFFEAVPAKVDQNVDTSALPSDFLVGYAPGQPAEILPVGEAKLVKAGSDIVFEVHYTPNGKAVMDRTKLGLVFAKEPPKNRVQTFSAVNGTFKIPPGDPNYRVDASFEIRKEVILASIHPHMHARGKDFEYRIVFPGGETRTILHVPQYNWHWQLWYNLDEPIVLPPGARIECTAHFDNSPNNPENPDPTKTVIWGAAELGRDDGWLLQPGLRSADLSQRLAAGKESCCEQQGFNRGSLTPKAEYSAPPTTPI